jgi:hypothetical protein
MIIKRGNGVPTVPASNDNNDGTWIATDIYEGEQYLDLNTGVVYTRSGNNIVAIPTPKGVYKANISQTGTDAPTVDKLHVNTLGTVSWIRNGIGNYSLLATGKFTQQPNVQVTLQNATGLVLGTSIWGIAGTDAVKIFTRDLTNVLEDGILDNTSISIEIW